MKDIVLLVSNKLRAHACLRRLLIVAVHCLGVCFAYAVAYELRYDGAIRSEEWMMILRRLPILLSVSVVVFALFRLNSGLWSFFSLDDLIKVIIASALSVALFAGIYYLTQGGTLAGHSRSVFFLTFILLAGWASSGRLIVRYFREHRLRKSSVLNDRGEVKEKVLIIGTLAQCDVVLRSARTNCMGEFVGVVSDNPKDNTYRFHGLPVFCCGLSEIGDKVKDLGATSLLILPPFNRPASMNDIVKSCVDAKVVCHFRQIPSLMELASGEIEVTTVKDVCIEDLLGRGERRLDRADVHDSVTDKRILVTGAGGSIGSELCRQIASYSPRLLVLFEINEFALYSIEMELKEAFPNLELTAFMGDIRHPEEVETAIEVGGGIDTIYHAAAYKHVPLMEENVPACFRNNVIGTHCLAAVAELCKVKRFVMISSDKAVRPSNIMGATKRIAERIINERPYYGTTFVAVRFGNVLGSSGSVIPLFKKQIASGGPVTVTSDKIRRFFMTIPEAVELVLQAGAVGNRGEVMVLEMGDEMKIVDLAKRLIELSGLVPGEDIKIEFTGLRPGEKEYEEVMTEDENLVQTPHSKIWVMKKTSDTNDVPSINIERLKELILANDEKSLRLMAIRYVPENMFKSTKSQRIPFTPSKT